MIGLGSDKDIHTYVLNAMFVTQVQNFTILPSLKAHTHLNKVFEYIYPYTLLIVTWFGSDLYYSMSEADLISTPYLPIPDHAT